MPNYEQRGYDRGFAQGFARGLEQGILQGAKRIVLRTIRARFSDVPQEMVDRIEAITDINVLDQLSERVLTAPTLAAMNISE